MGLLFFPLTLHGSGNVAWCLGLGRRGRSGAAGGRGEPACEPSPRGDDGLGAYRIAVRAVMRPRRLTDRTAGRPEGGGGTGGRQGADPACPPAFPPPQALAALATWGGRSHACVGTDVGAAGEHWAVELSAGPHNAGHSWLPPWQPCGGRCVCRQDLCLGGAASLCCTVLRPGAPAPALQPLAAASHAPILNPRCFVWRAGVAGPCCNNALTQAQHRTRPREGGMLQPTRPLAHERNE